MAFLSWRKEYEVGVLQIDTEHKNLFELLNEFHETYMRGDVRKEIPQVLNRLVAYAQTHFQHEEALMSESDYPLLDQHREMHSDLILSIFAINERLASDPAKASTETLQLVKEWLHNHILHEDMAIADFLQRKANHASKVSQEEPALTSDGETPEPKN